jgi:hypothetical protein
LFRGGLGHPFPQLVVVNVVHCLFLLFQESFENLAHIVLLCEDAVEGMRNHRKYKEVVVFITSIALLQELLQFVENINRRFSV